MLSHRDTHTATTHHDETQYSCSRRDFVLILLGSVVSSGMFVTETAYASITLCHGHAHFSVITKGLPNGKVFGWVYTELLKTTLVYATDVDLNKSVVR